MSLPQRLHRPDRVCAPDQKRGEAERKYGVAQACSEVLPEGRRCTGIVRREEHGQHKDESAEACGAYHDTENQREPDRQFAIGHQKGDACRVPENKTSQNGRHERISPSLEELVDPELKAAVKSKCGAKNLVLAEDQEKNTDADA